MSKKLWGGRFSEKTDPLVEEFTKSIQYDYKLGGFDVIGSLYQVEILKRAKLISLKEAGVLKKGLRHIFSSIRKGAFKIDFDAEDIHSIIQNALEKDIGKVALKLHTSRSRNDQVVFDTKLYCLENLFKTLELNSKFIKVLGLKASQYKDLIIPGFTHLQHAQPVSIVYHLGAYFEMLKRDNKRFSTVVDNLEVSLGAGAMAGTDIPAEFYKIKGAPFGKKLHPTTNPVDSVSDRDFVLEILSALSILGMHLSRIAEDLIIWSTKEFDFIELNESFCTGSSLMPQKKNPDVLELVRGYTGRLYGNLISVLVMMKGLPLTYNRDMQLDKEPLFNSFEVVHNALGVLSKIMSTLKFNRKKIGHQLEDESLYATDLAYYLVTKGIAFKDAHTMIGNMIRYSLKEEKKIKDMSNAELNRFSKFLDKKIVNRLINPKCSIKAKKSIGKR